MARDYPKVDARGRTMTAMTSCLYAQRIPVAELEDGHAYIIKARKSHVGIYKHDPGAPEHSANAVHSYDIARTKFNDTFIDNENDFDSLVYATTIPLKDLGSAPEFKDDAAKLEWLVVQLSVNYREYKSITSSAWIAFQASANQESS
jgi:hypothetical protein